MFIYNKDGKYIIEVSQGTTEEIKKQYGDDVFISFLYCGENAIIENNHVRTKTEFEKVKSGEKELEDGKYIKNQELIIIERPSDYHYWNKEQNKWIFDKNIKISELKEKIATEKEKVIESGFEIKTNEKTLIQKCREKDKTNILGTLQLMGSTGQSTIDWKFIDKNNIDVIEQVTKEFLTNILIQGAILTSKAIHVEQQLFIKIAALNEIELLNFDVENEFKSLMGG